MIMLSFLFVVLFLAVAQIVIVTRQLDDGGGAHNNYYEADFKHNSMRMQLRRTPSKIQSSISSSSIAAKDGRRAVEKLAETKNKKKKAKFFTSRTEELDIFPMTEHESGVDDEFVVVLEDVPQTYQDFLDEETRTSAGRGGGAFILAHPSSLVEHHHPNDDEVVDDYNYDYYESVQPREEEQNFEEEVVVATNNVKNQGFDDDEFDQVVEEEEELRGSTDSRHHNNQESTNDDDALRVERCAINLFGLPRAFASLVLPSLITNVLKPNHDYHCDYFIHYYNVTNEAAGRSGAGGDIDPKEILLLEQAVLLLAEAEMNNNNNNTDDTKKPLPSPPPRVIFISDSEDNFQNKYGAFLNIIHTTKDPQGRLLYFPWKSKSYTPTSVNNIVKMWHSIQSVWQLMEDYADQHFIDYTRVAMLRSDVVYVTPIDIWVGKNQSFDTENRQVIIPGFGRHPVSDRIVYGPYDAVKEWAANRFSSLDDHVDMMLDQHPGQGMHSERYVKYNIIPRIQKLSGGRGPFEVVESETICFFRARADESVWIEDCDGTENIALSSITQSLNLYNLQDRKALVESTLGRVCGEIHNFTRPDSTVAYLDCSTTTSTNTSFSSHVVDDHDEDDEDQMGKTMTRVETEAAIEEEIFLGLDTNTNETFDMTAEQKTTEEFQEKEIVTLEEEGAAGETDSQMENTDKTASKQLERTSSNEQELGLPEEPIGAGYTGSDKSRNAHRKRNKWSDDYTPHMTENDNGASEDWESEPDEDILSATM